MCNIHATFTLPSACLLFGCQHLLETPGREQPRQQHLRKAPGRAYVPRGGAESRASGEGGGVGSLVWHLAVPLHARRTLSLDSGGALMRETW